MAAIAPHAQSSLIPHAQSSLIPDCGLTHRLGSWPAAGVPHACPTTVEVSRARRHNGFAAKLS